jgi:hypothetical protein
MPYTAKDAPDYIPASKKEQWAAIWNRVYDENIKNGMSKDKAESDAFKKATGTINNARAEDAEYTVGVKGIGIGPAEYAETGPYHCQDCVYLKGRTAGDIFRDGSGRGRCNQVVMVNAPQYAHDPDGLAIVNIERGCCRYVDNLSILESARAWMAARLLEVRRALDVLGLP